MTANSIQPGAQTVGHPYAPRRLKLVTVILFTIALIYLQPINLHAQVTGGGSTDNFRHPPNPPVYHERKNEPAGGRLKDVPGTKPAISDPRIVGGAKSSASTPDNKAPKSASTAPKAGRTSAGIATPRAVASQTVAAATRIPTENFETVEDAIEAGNNARERKPADYVSAERAYQAAAKLASDDERAFIGLGNIYYDQRNFEQAVVAYRKAVELNPKNPIVFENLGNAYYELAQYKEAIDASSQSIRLDPQPPGAYFTLVWSNLTIDEGETAGNLANAFIYRWRPFFVGDQPYYVTFAGYLGYRQSGRVEEANKLLAVAPNSNECADQNWVCRLLKYLRHDISAEQLLKEASDNGRMTEAQTYIGLDLALSGKRAEGLPYLRWVAAKGDRTFTEYALATAWVKKLEGQ